MPSPEIVKALTLAELFSPNYRFVLPPFQRAYAWTTEHAGKLLADLLSESANGEGRGRHFLGRILLARPASSGPCSIIDGHQRIVTLTILLAVLRDLADSDEERRLLEELIGQDGPATAQLRLTPQASLRAFFLDHVQRPGATLIETEFDASVLSETEANVLFNRELLVQKLKDPDLRADVRKRLVVFIRDCCDVIVHEVEDEERGWSILQTEEQTGLEFSPTDRVKATLLSVIPQADREICAPIWEDWQNQLGSGELRALLGHIQSIRTRQRSERPTETILIAEWDLERNAVDFFQNELTMRGRQTLRLRAGEIGSGADRDAIKAHLRNLDWIDRNLWVPAALHWLTVREDDPETVLLFARLERLVWLLRIASVDPGERERRINRLLGEIDRNGPVDKCTELQIEGKLRAQALNNLRSNNIHRKAFCRPLLRRISTALGDPMEKLADGLITIEHVLPRNPPSKREWWSTFSKPKQLKAYTNRLGNLTLLTPEENREADSRNYGEKQGILQRSALEMSRHAARYRKWDQETIDARTNELIGLVFAEWDLKV